MLKSLKFVSRSAALNWRDYCPNLGPATSANMEATFGIETSYSWSSKIATTAFSLTTSKQFGYQNILGGE